ncbi:MAG: glutamate-1-semialdehyde 2,1-aminomutase [Firmicutes bacterium]|nr:glutamate-1-semialdehyde 2,1-aminomutase [Alicyclobacillaceae bacterium]MCL6498029.1 glutamate-1-semialdehyde 2,1-aminomutase [Bacillota bacterium]
MASVWERALKVLPGGVNSPVRSFRGVGGQPFIAERGEGPYLYDEDGRRYIDYVMSYGPLILGHAHPTVVAAVQDAAGRGLSFGTPTRAEVEMAERLTGAVPGLELVRMVNSGTEATMTALRVARAVTGRARVLKFEGCYHGHHDTLLIKAGSGAATLGVPDSEGVPTALAALTLTVPYNDAEAVAACFRTFGQEIAAVIFEPVAGNMGTVPAEPGFLETVARAARAAGALVVVDEVMTGFRVAWGGATRLYALEPDLVCLGKVIGAGMPVAAYGGRRPYMERVAPLGGVYQAGTLSGNPLAMAAGLAQLEVLSQPGQYQRLAAVTEALAVGLEERARRHGVEAVASWRPGMLTLFFRATPPKNFAEVAASDLSRFRRFFHGMREAGVFWPPSPFETAFPSLAHDATAVEQTLAAADQVFRAL